MAEDVARGLASQPSDAPESLITPSTSQGPSAEREPEDLALNLRDEIAPTAEDEALFLAVADELITSCLADRGLSYTDPAVPTAEEVAAQREQDQARELFSDEEMVRQHGYHWPRVVPDAGRYAEQFASVHPEWIECADLTRAQMRTPPEGDAGVPTWAVEATAQAHLGTFDAISGAVASWHQCMQGKGHLTADLRTPSETWDSSPQDEVTLALDDFECREASGYTTAKVSYLEQQTRQQLMDHRAAIQSYQTDLASRLELARRLGG